MITLRIIVKTAATADKQARGQRTAGHRARQTLPPGDRWDATEAQAFQLMSESIATGSQKTYQTAWSSWSLFCTEQKLDPLLQFSPDDFTRVTRAFTFEVAAIHHYILWAFFKKHLTASTIDNYLFGITFHLKLAGRDCDFIHSFPILRARAALNIRCRQRKASAERSSLPVSMTMIRHFADTHDLSQPKYLAIYTALLTAFTMLLRISEYVVVSGSNHHLRCGDVFFVVGGRQLSSDKLVFDHLESVSEVILKLRSSKTDTDGAGTTFCFPRNRDRPPTTDISYMLARWSATASRSNEHPFFSTLTSSGLWKISSLHIASAVKQLAIDFRFDSSRFTSHSLRYGGASTLAAAGLPDCWIQIYGRWKSLTFLQYIKLSHNIFDTIQHTMHTSNKFSHADIAKLLI